MSGAGKTQASNTLEDMGYYCMDNMPAALIAKFAELYTQTPGKAQNVAFILDVRGENEFNTLFEQLDMLKKRGYACRTVFIDCNDRVLLTMAAELLDMAAHRDLPQLDEKLYLDVFAPPETVAPRRASARR